MTFDILVTDASLIEARPEPPRCTCWKPTAPEHQYDCPMARDERRRRQRSDELIALVLDGAP